MRFRRRVFQFANLVALGWHPEVEVKVEVEVEVEVGVAQVETRKDVREGREGCRLTLRNFLVGMKVDRCILGTWDAVTHLSSYRKLDRSGGCGLFL